MKTYRYRADFHKPEDTYRTYTKGELRAYSEDQAHDRVEEIISDKYGRVLNLRLWVYELED